MDETIDKKTEEVICRFQAITENLNRVAEAMADLSEKMDRRFDELNKNMDQKCREVIEALIFLTLNSKEKSRP